MDFALPRSTDAMVLAAGLGTRLRPLTNLLPKPLVPVGDRPFIAHILGQLHRAGFTSVTVNAHHLVAALQAFARGRDDVRLSVEDDLLGTAGGVKRARALGLLAQERLLVINGDLQADVPVDALLAKAHRGVGAPEAVLLVAPSAGRGNVGIDAGGGVTRLRQETVRAGEVASFSYLGCALLEETVLCVLPASGCLVGDVFLPLLRRGARFETLVADTPWLDVGTPSSYLDANVRWLAAHGRAWWCGSGAQVCGVDLRASVVGEAAQIESGTVLDHCVVWPNTHVPRGTHQHAIFAPGLSPIGVRGQ